MTDPISQIIRLLRPKAVYSKAISGAGAWGVRYASFGRPSFCVVLTGQCLLHVEGQTALRLAPGDFVFLPATPAFTLCGFEEIVPTLIDPQSASSRSDIRHGRAGGKPDVRLLGGYYEFESANTDLLVNLLPPMVHVRGLERLALLVRLVREECAKRRAGSELILTRLVEVMLIEALRSAPSEDAAPGLLRALGDPRLAAALRVMHGESSRPWTVTQLAKKSALSRSAFFERFTQTVGCAPMTYLLTWRMAVAKELLRSQGLDVAQVAERVGYGSASTFSTAFSRHVGLPPSRFANAKAT